MKKKWFLYITGFFSGMSVMAIELGASRMLAPYFSSSQIVWTIIIGIIMIAMALGNILGGRLADKNQTPDKLFILLFSAAIWTGLIPLVGKFIISGIAVGLAMIVTKNYLIWAALLSCLVVFVYPLLILGMVTPNLVKFAVNDLSDNGRVVGKIEALNTIGSIIGTFTPTFITIPNIGTTLTFVLFAALLFIICAIYFFTRKKKRVEVSTVGVIVLIAGILSNSIGIAYWNKNIMYEGESIYNYLRVEETEDSIILSTNVLFGVQSVKMKEPGLTGMYYDYALAAPVMASATTEETNILILGLGTGTFATQCKNYFPDVNIDGVEIDEKIVNLAHKYFDLPESVNTYIEDGRAFMNSTKKTYDVIMVDAYQDITIPFQMSSIEFFTLVRDHLSERGVMIVNMNMYTSNEGGINDYLSSTIHHVFDSVYTVKSAANQELFASNAYDVKEQLTNEISTIEASDLKNMMSNRVQNNLTPYEKTKYLLTDDKAPVELLGMDVLDDMILTELSYFKEEIKGKSIKEILEMLFSGSF